MPKTFSTFLGLAVVLACLPLCAEERPAAEQIRYFESHVRPLLIQKCLKCHGEEKQQGKLRLDSREAILKGGESGPAIVPGKPQESLLVEAIRYESFEMPPTGELSQDQIAVLENWIALGAPWPQNLAVLRANDLEKITAEDRAWWAFQPVVKPEAPIDETDQWSRSEIDRFVLAKMKSQGLSPAPEADRETLIRRLYFDLVGLPPAPEQVAEFLADDSPRAYENLVDRLLANPAYGERWARHWLDLVRYADSDGYRIDHYRPQAWLYRDYVIEAFNNDKPYDRFVQEQLAGDELFPGDPQALVATGYLRHGIYEYNNRDVRDHWKNILEDVTDTTADVFLGLGLQCAKCHDHKFDPLLQKDYYRLQAFFAPILWRDDQPAATAAEQEAYLEQRKQWESKTAELQQQIDQLEAPFREKVAREAIEKFPPEIQAMINKPRGERTPLEHQLAQLAYKQVDYEFSNLEGKLSSQAKEKVLALKKQLSEFEKLKPAPLPLPLSISDVSDQPPPTFIPGREGETIAPGFITLLDPRPAEIPAAKISDSTGRRSALALWLTRPDNPLSTRVIVNRIWQYHFGQGLAANASDFGRLGEEPTHPQLLDWLTVRFLDRGWSIKSLHREIVTSATYRQSTRHPEFAKFQKIDPANRFYWRGDTRRLDAEQIRDAMLAVSGQLRIDQRGGEGVAADVPRRSIYTRIMRNARDPLLDAFDLPQFFSSESSRNTTTTPVQSLQLINSQQMLRHASQFAARVEKMGKNPEQRIAAAWRLAYGRAPSAEEMAFSLEFIQQQSTTSPGQLARENADVLTGKLPYRDGQAVRLEPETSQQRFQTPHHESLNVNAFTVEAFFQIRSVYESGSVRTIAAKWSGNGKSPGWALGVTGRGSRRKPQTLVLHMHGSLKEKGFGEAAIFSDQHVHLNKPYYAAAVFQPAGEQPGSVTFYLKDLSNDDEPLNIANIEHELTGGFHNSEPLTIGGSGSRSSLFDGLVDDLRITGRALPEEKLLYTAEGEAEGTLAYYRFESDPGLFQDSSPAGLNLKPFSQSEEKQNNAQAVWIDFCHGLLNSNEFLYVD